MEEITRGADEVTWERRRQLFSLDPAVAHLNHGSFGAVPIPVQRRQQRLRDEMDANPVAFFTRGLYERLADARHRLATFVGADPECTVLTANATSATQMVLGSLNPAPGDEILLTDHGYGAVRFAVDRLARATGLVAREVAVPRTATDDELVERLVGAVRPGRTRFAIVDHITSPTARLLPVARIVAALRERGVAVLVDGAHAPGMLPLTVPDLGADFWFGNLHKWAFAPRPTAMLVVAPERRSAMQPLVVSWEQENGFPSAHEFAGTLDYTAWLAAPAGLAVLDALGAERVRRHNADLAAYAQRRIGSAVGLDPAELPYPTGPISRADGAAGHNGAGELVSMRLIPLPPGIAGSRAAAGELRQRLRTELGCETMLESWQGQGFLRVSAQIYNRPEEYDRLAEGLPALLDATRSPSATGGRPV